MGAVFLGDGSMDLMRAMDEYCERLGPGLFAEPLNLLSNLAFLLAAIWSWRLAAAAYVPGHTILVPRKVFDRLAAVIFIVGVGSGLYHSFARLWAMWADVIPIGIFLFAYLAVFLRYVLRLKVGGILSGLGIFLALNIVLGIVIKPEWVNNSQQYFATVVALIVMGLMLQKRRYQGSIFFYGAAGMFVLSLIFRSVDMAVCPSLAYGTHFLWHITNALVLAFAMRGMLLVRGPAVS